MKLENFSHLPNIEKRHPEKRLTVFEKAIAIVPGNDEEREIYVAGINGKRMVVLSASLNEQNPRLIYPAVGIEPQYIKSYKIVESYR